MKHSQTYAESCKSIIIRTWLQLKDGHQLFLYPDLDVLRFVVLSPPLQEGPPVTVTLETEQPY